MDRVLTLAALPLAATAQITTAENTKCTSAEFLKDFTSIYPVPGILYGYLDCKNLASVQGIWLSSCNSLIVREILSLRQYKSNSSGNPSRGF
jgi:hypothetical protein